MALAHGPRLLLLDEPTSGLDPEARADMLALIAEIAGQGTTALLSTHVLGDVEAICPQVLVLSRGRLSFQGSVERFRAVARLGGGAGSGIGTRVELDGPAEALAARLRAEGVDAVAEGAALHLAAAPPPPEAFWRHCGQLGLGVRALQPDRAAMAEAFVRHLHLGDATRRVGEDA
jgi:ABC-type multidrug transport system ATPase subunit